MSKMAEYASDKGVDHVPQAWKRNQDHGRPVPNTLMNDLIKLGFIRTTFKGGPAYEILKWPSE
jgi:hypothetical protein